MTDDAMRCAGFWFANPDAEVCPHHEQPVSEEVMPRSEPYVCPKCCSEVIETPDGNVLGYYGRLVFVTDPPNPTCAACESQLIPAREFSLGQGHQYEPVTVAA